MTTVESGEGRFPASSGVIQPYTEPEPFFIGPLDEAIRRQNAILQSGTFTRPPQLHQLDNGKVLLVTEVTPHPIGGQDTPATGSRFGRWQPVILAGAAVLITAVGAVLLFLFVVGLKALVEWGIANALTIGAVLAVGMVAVVVFLGALAKARHGHPIRSGGGYYR